MIPDQFLQASNLRREGKRLYMEDVRLDLIAREAGTPVYVYSRSVIQDKWCRFDTAFGDRSHLVCYAVKACSNIAVLSLLSELGSGFDIVSGGELERVLKVNANPSKIFFSGVGKQAYEIEQALQADIGFFNVESASELDLLMQKSTSLGCKASVAVRVNPDVDVNTHPHIATGRYCDKFGVSFDIAQQMYEQIRQHSLLEGVGIDCHIGSQITDPAIYGKALEQVIDFADGLRANGHPISHIDIGGGFAISYDGASVPPIEDYINVINRLVGERDYKIVIEPGRSIVGDAGIILTEVLYIKAAPEKNFIIVDVAMNDLIRPALYQAHHCIAPLETSTATPVSYDVVGPVCESGDTLATDCSLNSREGDVVAVLSAGAYGFSMASNYNSRPRPAEVIVDGSDWHIVRLRESVADMINGECTLPNGLD